MQVNQVTNNYNNQAFGMRNILIDPSVMGLEEKTMQQLTKVLPDLYKIGDDKTDLLIKSTPVKVPVMGATDKNAVQTKQALSLISNDGLFEVECSILPEATEKGLKQVIDGVKFVVEQLKISHETPAAKMFEAAKSITAKFNVAPGTSRSEKPNIGFMADVKKRMNSQYSESKIGFQA